MNSSTEMPSQPTVVAVTGITGSGKSTVVSALQAKGFFTVSADELAREVVAVGTNGFILVKNHFGPEVMTPQGTLDRKKLGAIVFADPVQRAALESILHPLIRTRFEETVKVAWNTGRHRFVFYDIPLFFETHYEHPWIKKVVVVYAPESLCLQRIIFRDNLSEDLAKKRIASQISIEEKKRRADFVIDNSSTEEELTRSIELFLGWVTLLDTP